MGDIVVGQLPGQKRKEKMGERTQLWVNEMVNGLKVLEEGTCRTALFAPILPLPERQQSYYLMDLRDGLQQHLSGLVLYEADSVVSIPCSLSHLPRLCVEEPESPHKILDNVASGMDILTIPFIGAATDAGIALSFSFPPVQSIDGAEILPLGIDMWASEHATDLSALQKNCKCYTCANHHRAFVRHLLSAKEMLGWVLLQVHNYHVIDEFFAGLRQSLGQGSFHDDKVTFAKTYEPELPAKTGQGPRSAIYRFLARTIAHQLPG
jgi:queuine tRNA-ribosyltransferase